MLSNTSSTDSSSSCSTPTEEDEIKLPEGSYSEVFDALSAIELESYTDRLRARDIGVENAMDLIYLDDEILGSIGMKERDRKILLDFADIKSGQLSDWLRKRRMEKRLNSRLNNGVTNTEQDDDGGEWTLIGVPVTGETVADIDDNLLTQGGNSAIAVYDNSQGDYVHYATNANTALVAGKGYAIAPSGSSGTADITFTGTMSTASQVQAAVSRDASVAGNNGWWNLVGNPYPSYLMMTDNVDTAADSFLEVNKGNIHNSYEAVYAWDGSAWDIYNKNVQILMHLKINEPK